MSPGLVGPAATDSGRIARLVPASREAAEPGVPIPAAADRGEAFFAATAAGRRELLALIAKECAGQDAPVGDQPPADFKRLDAAVLEGRVGELIREFERTLDLPRSLCERIVNDPLGEPIVVAAAAARIPIAVLQRILLLINPAVSHSVERVFDLTNLYYELDRRAADRLMSLWREAAPRGESRRRLCRSPPKRCGRRSRCGRGSARSPNASRTARSLHDLIEKVPACTIFALDDPEVGIEAHLLGKVGFDLVLGSRHRLERSTEGAVGGALLGERRLRRGTVEIRCSIEAVDLDEDRSGLFGAVPAHRREQPLDVASPDVCRDPQSRFQTHGGCTGARSRKAADLSDEMLN